MEKVMSDQGDNAVDLLARLATAPADVRERLAVASALDDHESATIRLAVAGRDDAVSALALLMLHDWAALTPGERIAGLLVLAEHLADDQRVSSDRIDPAPTARSYDPTPDLAH